MKLSTNCFYGIGKSNLKINCRVIIFISENYIKISATNKGRQLLDFGLTTIHIVYYGLKPKMYCRTGDCRPMIFLR